MALLFSAGLVEAAFSYENTNVRIYPDKDGNAHIVEKIELRIDDENSAILYDSNIEITNDITSWKARTGIDKIRYHINPNVAPISNLRVIPQPKKRLSIINPSYSAILQIEYDATGLFNKTQVKARTYHYSIKEDALYFTYNTRNDIVLEDTDYLYIVLPNDVQIVSVDPLAQNIEMLTKDAHEFFWKGKTILQDFRFVYMYEETLKDEVVEYFRTLKDKMYGFINSQDGVYFLVMTLVLLVSYLLLKYKRPKE